VSFDSWGRGSRAKDTIDVLFPIAMSNWPFYGWPMLGIGAMETLRVMDWATSEFGMVPPFSVGGVSLGGDLAVAAAGLDKRVTCVAAANATPDWRRPGMHANGKLAPTGVPDAYAQFLYDRINPLTNLSSYAHRPAINFECGADDAHVPADGALRFRTALAGVYTGAMERLRVTLHPGVKHEFTPAMLENCIGWLKKYAGSRNA
jgi:dienelactone hydrolase